MTWSKRLPSLGRIAWLLPPFVVGLNMGMSGGHGTWEMVNPVLFFAFLILAVVLHEFGHALAALATSIGVRHIRLGVGRPVARWVMAGTRIDLNWLPFGGEVGARSKQVYFEPARFILFVAGGPAANLTLTLIAFAAIPNWSQSAIGLDKPQPLLMFGYANLMLGIGTLVPISAQRQDGRSRPSDGLLILNTILGLFSPEKSRAVAHVRRGAMWLEEQQLDRAIADSDAALKLDPTYAIAFCDRGVAYAAKGDALRAIAEYGEAIRLDPELTAALWNRAVTSFDQRDYARALGDFHALIKRGGGTADLWHNRGAALLGLGETDRAIADFSRAIGRNARLTQALKGRAVALGRQMKFNQALEDCDRAIALVPWDPETRHIRSRLRDAQDRFDDALVDLVVALQLATVSKDAGFVDRGIRLAKQGRYKEALANFERAMAIAPKSPWGSYNYAFTCALQGRDALALSHFERALAVAPAWPRPSMVAG